MSDFTGITITTDDELFIFGEPTIQTLGGEMTEMIERVAQAIQEAMAMPHGRLDPAVAAIEAMRDSLSDEARWAGAKAIQGPIGGSAYDAALDGWEAMFEVALRGAK